MLCVLSMSITAYAAEVTPTGETGAEDCRLTFALTDKTNGIFIDDIEITLLNTETNVEYTYTMTSADYLFGITVGGNVKQGNYNIALNYASKGQFTVQNADGTPISSFTADSTAHTFDWEVISNESTTKMTHREMRLPKIRRQRLLLWIQEMRKRTNYGAHF